VLARPEGLTLQLNSPHVIFLVPSWRCCIMGSEFTEIVCADDVAGVYPRYETVSTSSHHAGSSSSS